VIVDTATISYFATDSEIAASSSIADAQIVQKRLAIMIAVLATFDDVDINRYPSKIPKADNEVILVYTKDPVHMSIVLPNRHRINGFFGIITHGDDVYLLSTIDHLIIIARIRSRHFVVHRIDGNPIRPSEFLAV
jgi:hypothetical protein